MKNGKKIFDNAKASAANERRRRIFYFTIDKTALCRNYFMKGADIMTYDSSVQELDTAIKRIASGDKSALAEFYRITAPQVYSYSLSVLKSCADAEDVISDLLLEVWRCAPNYKSMGKPTAWVMTVARNLCKMKLRSRARLADSPAEEFAELSDSNDGRLSLEDRTVIRACLGVLSDREREVVIMHAVAGLKHREIAEILRLPLSTVISRYNTAIKKLGKELEGAL